MAIGAYPLTTLAMKSAISALTMARVSETVIYSNYENDAPQKIKKVTDIINIRLVLMFLALWAIRFFFTIGFSFL